MATDPDGLPGLNLLSFDGGGMGGLSMLVILRETMDRLQARTRLPSQPHPYKYFDLIAGAGTGAILAVMLGRLKLSVNEGIASYSHLMYETHSSKNRSSLSNPKTFNVKRLEQGLKNMVENVTGEVDERMMEENPNEGTCKVVIYARPDHSTNENIPCAFRTYPVESNGTPDCTIWEALQTSTTHPDLFEFRGSATRQLAKSSNPTLLLLKEAGTLFPGRSVASVISIGASHPSPVRGPLTSQLARLYRTLRHEILSENDPVGEELAVRFRNMRDIYYRLQVDAGHGKQIIGARERERQNRPQKRGFLRSLGRFRRDEAASHTKTNSQAEAIGNQFDLLVEAMVARQSSVATIQIDGHITIPLSLVTQRLKHCPRLTSMFKGRELELEKASCYFGFEAGAQHVFVMYGAGGAGKTQAALKSAELMVGRFEGVIFIDSSSRQSIETTLSRFAITEQIGSTYLDTLVWIERRKMRWLLLFDNVDGPDVRVHEYFPQTGGYDVLITTRHRALVHLARGEESNCNIAGMNAEEGYELLLASAGLSDNLLRSTEKETIITLLQHFGHLALSIVYCGTFISRTQGTIDAYFGTYISQGLGTLSCNNIWTDLECEPPQRSVCAAFMLNVTQLSECSGRVWKFLAFLDCNGISEDIFQRAYENTKTYRPIVPPTDSEVDAQREVNQMLRSFADETGTWNSGLFASAMEELASLSLVKFDTLNHSYHLNPLAQQLAQKTVARSTAIESSACLLACSIDREQRTGDHAFRRAVAPHVHAILRICPIPNSNHSWQFIAVYHEIGHQLPALEFQVAETRARLLGHQHPDTLNSKANLAKMYQISELGSVENKTDVLVVQLKALGLYHPYVQQIIASLIPAYEQQQESESASIPSMENTLIALKHAFKDDHDSLLKVITRLATLCHQGGQLNQARTLAEEVLIGYKQYSGNDHPDALRASVHLAATYTTSGWLKEAEVVKAEVLRSCKRLLGGSGCLITLRTTANLAAIYHWGGQFKDAIELKLIVVNASKKLLGVTHPSTLQGVASLASTYYKRGQLIEAEALQIEVLHNRRRMLGDNHPDTLRSMADLTATYYQQSRLIDAERLGVEVLEIRKRVLGNEHPDTLRCMGTLVATYCKQERLVDAEELGCETLTTQKRLLGNDHPDTMRSKARLAAIYRQRGRLGIANLLDAEVEVSIHKKSLGSDHPETIQRMEGLAWLYCQQYRPLDAERMFEDVLAVWMRVLGDNHPDTLRIMACLAETYFKQSRFEDARVLEKRLLAAKRGGHCGGHLHTLQSMANPKTINYQQGQLADAETLDIEIQVAGRRTHVSDPPEHMPRLTKTRDQCRYAKKPGGKVFAIGRRVIGDDRTYTSMSRRIQATTYQQRRQRAAAEFMNSVDPQLSDNTYSNLRFLLDP